MSWIAHSETPFANAQKAVIDVSGLSEDFRDGQKLRQEYEARQQQKALNEIMRTQDHAGRLDLARQHRYAGALVPLLQKYDEDRQKAALDNLKASADIGKVYGETGKLGAETGEIGAKTQSQNLKNIGEGNNILANSAAGLDRTAANLTIGQLYNAGFYTASQTEMLLQKANSGKPEDIEFLKSIARTNPELAKLFQPKAQVLDAKDAAYMYTTDGFTGEAGKPTQKVAYGQSPDNILDNETSRLNNQNTVRGSMYNSDNTYNASVYGTDVRSSDARYNTDVTSQDRQLKLDQDGQIEWAKVSQTQQTLDNPQANRNPIPPSAMKTMGELQEKLVSNAQTMTENGKWMKRLQSGELQLGAVQNFGNTAAARTGITSLGSNPEAYAEFNAYIKDLANKALRLNAGVQTDADYKRQLEAIVSGGGMPKDNGIAFGLLNRIHKDFDSQNRGIYQNLASYKKEYAGVNVPAYGQNKGKKRTASNPSKPSQGASIIRSIGGG